MERNVWTTAPDSWNSCVEVKWVSACSSGGCVEVGHDGDRVLVRDSKQSPDLAPISVLPGQWLDFVVVAANWDRESTVYGGGLRLMNTQGVATDLPVCIADESKMRHLHFTWKEWDTFVEGVKAGLFEVGE